MSDYANLPIFQILAAEAMHAANILPLSAAEGQLVRERTGIKYVFTLMDDERLDRLLVIRIGRLEAHGLRVLGTDDEVANSLAETVRVRPDGVDWPAPMRDWSETTHGELIKAIAVQDYSWRLYNLAKARLPSDYPSSIAEFGELALSSPSFAAAFLNMTYPGSIRADPAFIAAVKGLVAPARALVSLATKGRVPRMPLTDVPTPVKPRASNRHRRAPHPPPPAPLAPPPPNRKGKNKRDRSPTPPAPACRQAAGKKMKEDDTYTAFREPSVPLSDTTEVSIHSAPSPPHVIDEPLEDVEMEQVEIARVRECFGGLSKLGDDDQREEAGREIQVEDMDWEAAAEYVDEEGLQHGEVIEPEDDEIGPLAMVIWEDPLRVYPVLPIVEVGDPWEHVEGGAAEEEDVLEIPRPPAEDGLPRMAYHGDRLHAGDIRDGPIIYRVWIEIVVGEVEEEE
ncbi:uncharacterized protein MKK02DRAFT_31039 [Dioszegia hungarica]|uniref:Uncharacterized protein n=1 Tax=Dioszegia hungarica TaxID=4972 RepID=A0AA38LXK1_9TREE|nr:uncharacterized protein MKK02DRAFT_31039 [Dioszegia hungarica]KAI9638713.1 hypothetical protein MKK02DRAFT_31039 [Dioszegia hungarica]